MRKNEDSPDRIADVEQLAKLLHPLPEHDRNEVLKRFASIVESHRAEAVEGFRIAARAKGMTDAQHAELLAVLSLAGRTNHLVSAMQVPVDPEFDSQG